MERIFTNNLKKELIKFVKCEVSVHIIDNTLVVHLSSNIISPFIYTLDNIAGEIVQGLSAINVAQAIVKQYKKYILNRYFYSKSFN